MTDVKIKVCSETAVNLKKVRTVEQELPPTTEVVSLAETFKILGDPTRLKIVLALAREELCVCDLATLFSLSVSAISHQLRLLRGMKLVKYRKAGKMVYYSLDDEHIMVALNPADRPVEVTLPDRLISTKPELLYGCEDSLNHQGGKWTIGLPGVSAAVYRL